MTRVTKSFPPQLQVSSPNMDRIADRNKNAIKVSSRLTELSTQTRGLLLCPRSQVRIVVNKERVRAYPLIQPYPILSFSHRLYHVLDNNKITTAVIAYRWYSARRCHSHMAIWMFMVFDLSALDASHRVSAVRMPISRRQRSSIAYWLIVM